MSYHVYSKHLTTKKENYLASFEKEKEAVNHCRTCYHIDEKSHQANEYYYFIKER